ncbi:DegT/DnrJ/EryC1/StrS family aminotransferase [Candidatus Atelocyanobacterium thalassae]|uniref:dTDP-3-amino-3,4,6-trideoxy-alpha-D-glucose transaminase n=1 Tax=cyanobacterium endosymbiont of Braarudosphaera bigelowii TaxID=1285375 RepID=A0ABM7U5W5_9CHRO|nr:DegT/DnrJ/EryC1/StrS family aminotransferase [Candidatus Atelocyanobacterium thalassa]BDA40156.1 dTDP-3-amino-3,4,6-trideoxy-alpha-D-glucose transaminase [cyanobacterium endosymbiont of Braarudosphaera bigelowii]
MQVNTIPPVDLVRQYESINKEIDNAILKVVRSGHYIGGSVVKDFEQQLSQYIGTSQCLTCNSGTDALYLALKALNIGFDDEVITTPFSFIATAETISLVGAKPVFADIERDTFNLDLENIEKTISPRTKAIIVVHLFGQPVNMTRLMEIANKHNLYVIEDCAQATGAKWEKKVVGSIGHVGCFSFFPTKNLGACGDGGAITTNDSRVAQTIRIIKEHGSMQRYHHDVVGINSRLDTIQAGILQVKLSYLDTWNEQRRKIADYYDKLLNSVSMIKLPKEIMGGYHVWNQYTVLVENKINNKKYNRDILKKGLEDQGIISMVYYPIPIHLQKVYVNLGYKEMSFPITEKVSHEVLSLPIFPGMLPQEQEQVANAIKASFNT